MLGVDPKTARAAWAHAVVYATVLLLLCVVWVIRRTLLVFATALMVAYLLYPLVDAIDRRLSWKTRTPALVLPFVLMFALLTAFGWLIKEPLSREYGALNEQIQKKGLKQEVADWRPLGLNVGEHIVGEFTQGQIAGIIPQLSKALFTAVRYLLNLVIIPILSFFALKDGRRIRDSVIEMFHSKRQVESVLMDAHALLLEYMRALLFLCLATLISFTIALSVMHVKYPILLALVASALEFVPMVGPLTSAIVIISVSHFSHYQHIPWVVVFLIGYRIFQDYVLSPHLMKKRVKLHPLLVLFGIFAGGEIGGVPGIFLSVPVLALVRLVFFEWRKRRVVSKELVLFAEAES
jgi:predicted PurR-regulated permease PerM